MSDFRYCSSASVRILVLVMSVLVLICDVESRAVPRPQQRQQVGQFDGMEYLADFGYLGRANFETGALRSRVELETAVKEFQQMAGLNPTGQLDQTTIAKMKTPRCGIADRNRTANGPQNFVLGPSKWEKKDLTYRLKNYTPDMYWGDSREAVAQAFQIWSDVSPLTFREVTGPADIEISFAPGYHDDGYAFDGRGSVLAHAFPPGDGRGGDAHFDEDESWTVRTQTGTNLFTVAAHEFGHSLGIYHSNEQGALMYPWYQGYVPDLKLHSDDIRAIQTLYGSPGKQTQPPRTIPPTRPQQTVTPPTIPTVRPTTPRRPSDDEPEPCFSDVDAVTKIRGEVFAFKGKYFWRMNRDGDQVDRIAKIRQFWQILPEEVTYIDAIYERQDRNIVIFKGNRLWELNGLHLASGCPKEGKPLTAYGLDPGVTHIDAIFVWGLNQRTYIFSGFSYWKMNKEGTRVEANYPRPTDIWTGIPIPFDTVFTHTDGKTYFIKGTQMWALNDQAMRVEKGYPKPLRELWKNFNCPGALTSGSTRTLSTSLNTLAVLTLIVILRKAMY